jgi:HTH-type transcriptional regulator / antitoxin HigA
MEEMGVRNTAVIDPVKYGRLCADALPRVITSDREFDRMSAKLEELDFKARKTPEEAALAELLAKLIKDYDDKHHALPALPPNRMIAFLMEQKGMRQADLLPVLGSRSITSDLVSGKREPSKAHIRRLAEFFKVSAELFL